MGIASTFDAKDQSQSPKEPGDVTIYRIAERGTYQASYMTFGPLLLSIKLFDDSFVGP